MAHDLPALRDLAVAAARCGADAALPLFRDSRLVVDNKIDESPVTQADRASEAAIKAHIQQARPDDAWLGEETGTESGQSGLIWIVDPIDGTRNFIRGVPLWATLVACCEEHGDRYEPIASCALIPALGECYEAYHGGGARCDGVPLAVSPIADPTGALWCFETPSWFKRQGLWDLFEALEQSTGLSRGLCDAYGHMLVASGRAELVVEPELSIWDVAATSLIVREAGGHFTDLAGANSIASGNAVVTNAALAGWTQNLINHHPRTP